MVRNVLGTVLALIGATAAVWSPFRAWYDGRHGRHFRLDELFSGTGVTGADAELFGSLFLPFAFAALLTLAGLLLRSRLLVTAAGVVVLGFAVLWMVRQGQAAGSLSVSGDGSGLGLGVLGALGGGVLLLLSAALLSGRHRTAPRRFAHRRPGRERENGPYAPEHGNGPRDPAYGYGYGSRTPEYGNGPRTPEYEDDPHARDTAAIPHTWQNGTYARGTDPVAAHEPPPPPPPHPQAPPADPDDPAGWRQPPER
ncbi:hypothetical protein [Streptomyces alboniger]|uniref:hypothetical protein n=1 Tax=Streptomyces alboniger TaxID=132473 RepID=UPI000A49EF3D|nr:hypothetical protein [Streptomyces alboniger]